MQSHIPVGDRLIVLIVINQPENPKYNQLAFDFILDNRGITWTIANLFCVVHRLGWPDGETHAILSHEGMRLSDENPHRPIKDFAVNKWVTLDLEFVSERVWHSCTESYGVWPMRKFEFPRCECGRCHRFEDLEKHLTTNFSMDLRRISWLLCIGDIEGRRYPYDKMVESPRPTKRKVGILNVDDFSSTPLAPFPM